MRTRRMVVGALLVGAVLGPGTAQAESDLTFEVRPTSRFISGRALSGLPERRLARRVKRVPMTIVPSPAACAPSATWRIDEQIMPGPGTDGDGAACPFKVRLPAARRTRLDVTVGSVAPPVTEAPRPDDLLVVALGDAIAAGSRRAAGCRTSSDGGFEQAARLLAQVAPTRTITFVNLACAGATIQDGVRPAREPTGRSQVERLDRLLRRSRRHADAVVLSVGAGDLRLGDLVRRCRRVADCSRAPTRREALALLPRHLDGLAGDLAATGRVEPGAVVLAEYPDPTRQATGRVCRTSDDRARTLTRAELRWASDTLLRPLNQELAAAADRNKWKLAGGIAGDFATHGVCTAAGQRWVSRSLVPNRRGQLAIANRVALPLGSVLGLVEPTPKPRRGEGTPWLWIGIGVALAVLILLALRGRAWAKRLFDLPRSGHPRTLERRPRPRSPAPAPTDGFAGLVQLAAKAAGLLGSVVFTLGFVAAAGAAILWVRFWAARYPADQAVRAVSRDELLVIGGQAIGVFACVAVAAVVVMWVLDPAGTHGRRIRLSLAVLVFAELIAAGVLGDFSPAQRLVLAFGFALGATLLLFLFEVAQRQVVAFECRREAAEIRKALASGHSTDDPGEWRLLARRYISVPPPWRSATKLTWVLWQLLPIGLLAGAMVAVTAAWVTSGRDRWVFVLLPIALAAVLFVAPKGVAGAAQDRLDPSLRPVRAALAAVLVFCMAGFLVTDERWLAIATVAAVFLAGVCLVVARASGHRFVPFGVTVFFAVCAYGAIVSCVRIIDSPQAQPVAVLLKDERMVCGLWVGESGDRVWYANLQLSERGAGRRPAPRRSALASVARGDVVDMALGPLQPVGRAQDQAVVLRDGLEREHPSATDRAHSSCGAPPVRPQRPVQSVERRLARLVQPELVVDRKDGFWPIPVRSVFAMEDRRARVCRRVEDGACVRVTSQSDLTFNGGEGEWLDYPADELHRDEQQRVLVDALGSVDPMRTGQEYFLVTRGRGKHAPWTVQFWFFYGFNYLRTGFSGPLRHYAGFHEGDFENIGILLSAKRHQPRYVWMARHKDEGRAFVWDEETMEKVGGHLRVYAATGSHATYENCWRQARVQAPLGLIDDRPQCKATQALHLAPESTPLIDLSRVPWACWRGGFGAHGGKDIGQRVPYESDDGPRGPLWQQRFGGVTSEPCRGIRADPQDRDRGRRSDGRLADSRDDEMLGNRVSRRLRARAGHLDPLVDSCADWERAPTSGALVVACDARRLQRFIKSGLERPGKGGLRIDVVASTQPRTGPVTVPAVRRDPKAVRFSDWRVSTTRPTTARIYAACQSGNGLLEARFPQVKIEPGQPLRVDDRPEEPWRLVRQDGTPVGDAVAPEVVKELDKESTPHDCHS